MLEVKELSYQLGQQRLIEDITMQLHPGELYGILGPNGSGKSTLLKNICGIWKPSKGEVLWQGRELHGQERSRISRTVTYVPQTPSPPFAYSVEEIVAMARYPHDGNRSTKNAAIIRRSLEAVDVWQFRHRPLQDLSCGERQRVYLARALATECPIILLDEPTAALDIRHQIQIWDLLQNLIQDKRMIVAATHDIPMTRRYCDQLHILCDGKHVASGSPEATLTEKNLASVFGVTESLSSGTRGFFLPSQPNVN